MFFPFPTLIGKKIVSVARKVNRLLVLLAEEFVEAVETTFPERAAGVEPEQNWLRAGRGCRTSVDT
jgi:hypothetical protein